MNKSIDGLIFEILKEVAGTQQSKQSLTEAQTRIDFLKAQKTEEN